MKLNHTITIHLREFFLKGKFDHLKLGQSKEWVLEHFPDPDGMDQYPELVHQDVWVYGNIELHFTNNKLFLIFSDYLPGLYGGPSLKLDLWFLKEKKDISLGEVTSYFHAKHIDYSKSTKCYGECIVRLMLKSGVQLGFALHEEVDEDIEAYYQRSRETSQDEFSLISFSYMQEGKST